jgi:hypothetical protein
MRIRRAWWLVATIVFAACGQDSGPDPNPVTPAPDAHPAPKSLTISGTLTEGLNRTPTKDGKVTVLQADEVTVVGTPVTTDANGNYSITLTTTGEALNVVGRFAKPAGSSYVTEWLYPGEAVDHDLTMIDGVFLKPADLDTFAILFTGPYDSQSGLVAILVVDSTGKPAAGATVTISPAPDSMRYANDMGNPDASFHSTSSKGIVYAWNVPIAGAGNTAVVTVSGMLGAAPLKTHTLKAHRGEISLTLLKP